MYFIPWKQASFAHVVVDAVAHGVGEVCTHSSLPLSLIHLGRCKYMAAYCYLDATVTSCHTARTYLKAIGLQALWFNADDNIPIPYNCQHYVKQA